MILDSSIPILIQEEFFVVPNYKGKKWLKGNGIININGITAYGNGTTFLKDFKQGDVFAIEVSLTTMWSVSIT